MNNKYPINKQPHLKTNKEQQKLIKYQLNTEELIVQNSKLINQVVSLKQQNQSLQIEKNQIENEMVGIYKMNDDKSQQLINEIISLKNNIQVLQKDRILNLYTSQQQKVQIDDLQQQIISLQNENKLILLENDNMKLQLRQINELQDYTNQLSQQIEEVSKQNSILSFEKNEINQQFSDLNLKYNLKLEQEKKNLKSKKKQLEKFNKIIAMKDENDITIEKKKKKLQKEYSQSQKQQQINQIEILKPQIDNFQKQFINLEVNQKCQYIDESQHGYDMIIKMQSLYDLQNNIQNEIKQQNEDPSSIGGKISGLMIQKFKKDFEPDLQDVIVVGLQGQRNKGKTFILNSLINEDFPSGFHLSTPGVCIKQHQVQNKKIVYIDSEGLGNPISMDYENNLHYQTLIEYKRKSQKFDEISFQKLNKNINDKYYDIKANEQIKQEFIIQNSNILIVVISQVTIEEQKLIDFISERLKDDLLKNVIRKIIVIHNLKDFHKPEYMKEYMIQLKKFFSVKEQVIDNYKEQENEVHCNTILFDEVRPHITHVLMGYKDSEAGRQYNKFALHYIKQVIALCKDLQKFDIREKLKKYLNQNLHKFIEIKNELKDEIKQSSEKNEMLEYSEENQKIFLKEGYVLERLKELSINIFGSFYRYNYSIVKSRQNPDKELFLLVEIPGTAKFERKFDKIKGEFILKITQNDEIEKSVGEHIKLTTKVFEEKQIPIQICKEKELWSYIRDRDIDLKNGVYKFVFTKNDENEEFS